MIDIDPELETTPHAVRDGDAGGDAATFVGRVDAIGHCDRRIFGGPDKAAEARL